MHPELITYAYLHIYSHLYNQTESPFNPKDLQSQSLKAAGLLYTWGSSDSGVLGLGQFITSGPLHTPTKVVGEGRAGGLSMEFCWLRQVSRVRE